MENGNNALRIVDKNEMQLSHMSVQELVAQKDFIQEVSRTVMKKGKHYGTIPGCGDALVLFKSGAEILSTTFQMAPEFDVKIVDLLRGHREYQVKCSLKSRNTGKFISDGVGSCSTMESKYRYRTSSRKCPKCDKETIIKGKQEYGGGWLCFGKKGGCGAKFSDTDPSIVSQPIGKVENENIADAYNTCLKMAKKRAFVDANITATSTSDIFLQDLDEDAEEMAESGEIVASVPPKAYHAKDVKPQSTKPAYPEQDAIEPETPQEDENRPVFDPIESKKVADELKSRPAPKDFAKEEEMGTVTIIVAEIRENEYQPGKFKWGIKDMNGDWYSTFSSTVRDTAKSLGDAPGLLTYKVQQSKTGGMKLYKNVVELRKAIEPAGV